MSVVLLEGDCRKQMGQMIRDKIKVDSIITDPPYEYKFMSKSWDATGIAYNPKVWRRTYRLLKPGGYLLAFGGTRTYHRMVCAIEDAGFEIRDSIQWLYGSGYPKSRDISKAIDKQRKEDLEPIRVICRYLRTAMEAKSLKSKHLAESFGNCSPRRINHWAARDSDSQPELPTWDQWLKLKIILDLNDEMDAEVWRLNGRKGQFGDAWQNAEVIGLSKHKSGISTKGTKDHRTVGGTIAKHVEIKAPATEAAKQWVGWGTALKPACEIIVLARRPLSEKTVAQNVLNHGTGAINIDECRIKGRERTEYELKSAIRSQGSTYGAPSASADFDSSKGRWPSNVIHDGSKQVLDLFAAFGEKHGPGGPAKASSVGTGTGVTYRAQKSQGTIYPGDTGTAARFFQGCPLDAQDAEFLRFHYCAKANKKDRMGTNHPTTKPSNLICYLARLVTPPGGTILDPFAGSGTLAVAAQREGFNAILIEKEPEYLEMIRKRFEVLGLKPRVRKKKRKKTTKT